MGAHLLREFLRDLDRRRQLKNKYSLAYLILFAIFAFLTTSCGGKANRPPAVASEPPIEAEETAPEETAPEEPRAPSSPAPRSSGNLVRQPDPLGIEEKTLDEINTLQPFEDVHFEFDSATVDIAGRGILNAHSRILKQYPNMTILIEGHCDERGTVEYNLALGERRANSVQNSLINLGIAAHRVRIITYGKEFPLDSGHNESAWTANRRARFEITAK